MNRLILASISFVMLGGCASMQPQDWDELRQTIIVVGEQTRDYAAFYLENREQIRAILAEYGLFQEDDAEAETALLTLIRDEFRSNFVDIVVTEGRMPNEDEVRQGVLDILEVWSQ